MVTKYTSMSISHELLILRGLLYHYIVYMQNKNYHAACTFYFIFQQLHRKCFPSQKYFVMQLRPNISQYYSRFH